MVGQMFAHKSYEALTRYRRSVDSYRSTVSDTAKRIGAKIAKRRLTDREGIQADIALLEHDVLWLGQHHLPRAYMLGHGRLREDLRAGASIAGAIALNDAAIRSKLIPAVRAATVNVQPDQAAFDRLLAMLEDEDVDELEARLRKRNDPESAALLAILASISGITDPVQRRAVAMSNIPVGLAAGGLLFLGSWAATLSGRFWATIWQGKMDKVAYEHGGQPMPVKRTLNDGAKHCDTCPSKAGTYDSWEEMLSECGGLPGSGSDACFSSCRCELWEWNGTTWVMT